MKKSPPPRPTKPLARKARKRKPIAERVRIAKKSRKSGHKNKRAATFARAFGSIERVEWMHTVGCSVCSRGPVEIAHAKSRGAGGTSADTLPLCREHHHEQHAVGIRTFEAKYGIDMTAAAAQMESLWQALA